MNKMLKIAGISVAILIILLTLSAILLTLFVNPNTFKGKISQYVFAKTGQVFVIKGDLHWSFFPWIGIKADNLVYYNSPKFEPKVFASAKEMDLKIKFLPLLAGHVETGNVTFNHLVLNLIKNKNAENNWQSLGQKKYEDQTPPTEPALNPHQLKSIAKMTITSLNIKNSVINWINQHDHQQLSFNNFNLHSHNIKLYQPFPISLNFTASQNAKDLANLAINTKIVLDPTHQHYQLENLTLKGQLLDEQYANGKLPFQTQSNTTVDLKNKPYPQS